jgi:hypothetical protein
MLLQMLAVDLLVFLVRSCFAASINVHHKFVRTPEEIDAELRERGLPVELLEHLRMMPDVLQDGEDPDPYGLFKDVTPEMTPDDTAK